MGILPKVLTRTALSSIYKQLTIGKDAAFSNPNVLNWGQNNYSHNDIVRKMSFRFIAPKPVEYSKGPFSPNDDNIILEHVKTYGDNIETWKILAIKFNRNCIIFL